MINRYYEDELHKLKSLAVEFAQANPALAPMLAAASADPDVERLLEGVAFLTGLTRQKLDDEFPEFVQELANLLFPYYLRPIPASTLVSFTAKGMLSETATIPAGTEIASVAVDGTSCRFRTCHDLEVPPLVLQQTRLDGGAGTSPRLVLDFDCMGGEVDRWGGDVLRLFLGGGYAEGAKLLLLLAKHVTFVRIGNDDSTWELDPRALRPAGFDNPMLPSPSHAFPGFRTVQEFFVLPEKFLFVELKGLARWTTSGKGSRFTLTLGLDRVPDWMPEIHADSFLLNVVPAINLFPHEAAPITHDHRVTEYRVRPEGDNSQHYQVYGVDEVTGYQQGVAKERVYRPFGALRGNDRHGVPSYHTVIRPAAVGRGSDTFLSVNYAPGTEPVPETLSLRITCTNRHLPESLQLGDLCRPTGSSPERMNFQNIRPITPSISPPTGEALLWRVIGMVSLNLLSIANAENLKSLLALHIFGERSEQGATAANRRRIDGIEAVTATPETRLVGRGSVLRGQRVQVKCRPDHFGGIGDLYLFGCMLDHFLSNYAGINAYTRVELVDAFSGAVFTWPPRLGQQTLL